MNPSSFTESRQCYVQFNSAVARLINLYETVYKRIYGNSRVFIVDRSLLATAIKSNPLIVIENVGPILHQFKDDIMNGNLEVVSGIDFFKFGKDENNEIKIKKHEMECKRLLKMSTELEKNTLIETARFMLQLSVRYEVLRKMNK
jgi:hypothetical protein